jgi:hypothetical protein
MTIEEAQPIITEKLTTQRVDQLDEKVRDVLRNTLRADYDAYKAATAGSGSTVAPPSSLGVPFNSYEYLQKLRDKIQTDFKVTVGIEQQDAWQINKTLADSRFSKFSYDTQTGGSIPFASYLTAFVEPFLTEAQKKALSARTETRPISLWEPTPAFRNNDDLVIARVAAADPTHVPASVEEVREKVIADAKLAAAREKAKQAAQALLDAATKGNKFLQTVANEQKLKTITTGPLRSDQANAPDATIPNTDIKGRAAEQLITGAFKLLTQPAREGSALRPTTQATPLVASTQPTPFKEHPIGLIDLPADGKVVVAEVDSLKPSWTKESQAFPDALVASRERMENEMILRNQWFNYDNVTQRTNYAPVEKRDRKPRQPAPPNPFTGTIIP